MAAPATPSVAVDRPALVRRGRRLGALTLAWNGVEGLVAVAAGVGAGSVALMGFGIDSGIELAAAGVALWRLSADADAARRAHAERVGHRVIGALFLALAVYVAADAAVALGQREAPGASPVGIALAAASLLVMPWLARAKRRVGAALGSRTLVAESAQTSLCTWLSAILLGGLLLNATLGWWWADPAAALVMAPIIAKEGLAGLRGEPPCADGCH